MNESGGVRGDSSSQTDARGIADSRSWLRDLLSTGSRPVAAGAEELRRRFARRLALAQLRRESAHLRAERSVFDALAALLAGRTDRTGADGDGPAVGDDDRADRPIPLGASGAADATDADRAHRTLPGGAGEGDLDGIAVERRETPAEPGKVPAEPESGTAVGGTEAGDDV